MNDLIITSSEKTPFTPNVHFNAKTGECAVEGESYPEQSFEFYQSLIRWVKDYFEGGAESIKMDFKLTYFNTSSGRAILDLLRLLKEYEEQGRTITVNWYYPVPDDDDMKMEAEDFIDETELELNLIPYELT